jgi:hypothetical protein
VVGSPGRIVRQRGAEGMLEHGLLPDPEAQEIDDLRERIADLEKQVQALVGQEVVRHANR